MRSFRVGTGCPKGIARTGISFLLDQRNDLLPNPKKKMVSRKRKGNKFQLNNEMDLVLVAC